MAEYRGLTIRIGADVGNFKAALQSTQQAISATQKNLNELKKSLVLDPGNKNVAADYVGELQSQAVAASAKISVLQQQMRSISETLSKSSEGTKIGQMAEEVDDAALRYKRAVEAVNNYREALAQINKTLNATQEAKGLEIELKSPKTSIELYRQIYDQLVANGKMSREQADQELATVARLKSAWQGANDERADADLVLQLHNATMEADRLEASVRAAAKQMVEMSRSEIADNIEEAVHKADLLSEDAEKAKSLFEVLDDAVKLDPTNIDLVRERSEALTAAIASASERANALKDVIGEYESAGIGDVARSTEHLAERTEQARTAFEDANYQVEKLRGLIDTAESAMEELVARDEQGSREYGELSQAADLFRESLARAKTEAERLGQEYHELDDAGDFKDKSVEAQNLANQVSRLRQAYHELNVAQVEAFEGSGINQTWQNTRSTIEALTTGIGDASTRIQALDKSLELNPGNLDIVTEKVAAIRDGAALADAKVESLEQILESFRSAGVDSLSIGIADATKNLEDARERAITARDAVADLKVELSMSGVDGSRPIREIRDDLKAARAEAHNANYELRQAQDIVAYREVSAQLIEAKNSASGFRQTLDGVAESFANVARGSELSDTVSKMSVSVERLAEDAKLAADRFSTLDSSAKLDTTNIELAERRFDMLVEASTLAHDRVDALREVISRYEAGGIDQLANSTRNTSQYAKEMGDAYEAALAEVVRVSDELQTAKQHQAQLREEGKAAGNNWIQAAKDVHSLEEQLTQAQQAAVEARNAADDAVDAVSYKKACSELEQANLAAQKLDEAFKNLAKSEMDAVVKAAGKDFTDASNKIKNLTTEVERAEKRFNALDAAFKLDPGNAEIAAQRMQALAEKEALAKERADAIKAALRNLSTDEIMHLVSNTSNLTQGLEDAKREFLEASEAVAQLEQRMDSAGDETGELATQLEQAKGRLSAAKDSLTDFVKADALRDMQGESAVATQQMVESVNKAHESIKTSSLLILQEVGQLARQTFSSVVSATTDIDDALTSIKKTVDATDSQYEALKDAAIEASKVQPIDAATIMNAEALGGQLGFMVDEVQKFAEVATGLDVSTNMGWEQASTNLAQFANIMQMSHDDVDRYGSAIVELGNNFATTESDISDMAMRIAGAGASMGLSEADVLGLSAALTSMGLTAEAGGSSISQIMVKIDKAVAQGTDGIDEWANKVGMGRNQFIDFVRSLDDDALSDYAKKFGMTTKAFLGETLDQVDALEVWADTANMTSEEFVKAWGDRPIEAIEALFAGMEEAGEEGTNLNLLLEELGITTIRQSDVARRLANNSSLVSEAVEASNSAWDENTALSTEVARRNESLSAQMEMMKNAVTALGNELGEGLFPIVKAGVQVMQGLSSILNEVPTPIKTVAIGLVGIVGPLATMVPILMKAHEAFSSIHVALGTLSGAAGVAAGAGGGLAGTFATVLAHINPLVVGIGALALVVGGTLVSKYMQAKKEQDDFNAALADMKGYASGSSEAASEYAAAVKSVLDPTKEAGLSIKDLTDKIVAHNDAMRSIQTEHDKDAALLREYQQVINDATYAWNEQTQQYELSNESMSEVQWALDGINELLGTNITMEQLLAGAYEDENGEIQNTIDMLNELIDAREREALTQANQQILTEARKNQYDMDLNLRNAERELADSQAYVAERTDELMESYKKLAEERGQTLDDSNIAQLQADAEKQAWGELGTSLDELQRNYDAAATAAGYAADEVEYAHNNMTNSAALAAAVEDIGDYEEALHEAGLESDALAIIAPDSFKRILDESGGDINKIVAEVKDYNDALTNNAAAIRVMAKESPEYLSALGDIDLTVFSESLDEAGIKVADLERIGSEKFAQLVSESGGNLDTLTKLLDLAAMELDDTSLAVSKFADEFPEYGLALDQANVGLNDFAQKCEEAGITTDQIRAIGSDNFNALCKACNGDVDKIIEKIEEFNRRELQDKDVQVTAAGNIISGEAEEAVRRLIDWQSRLYDKTVWWTANVKVQGDLSTAGAYAEKFGNAAGGIRFHAYGGIVDRPSWLGTRDIVGEAGAEAIIPLTNRKYVSPFADTVAEELLQKMGTQGGDNITIQLNYEAGTDANKMVRELARGIQMHKATKGRW